MAVPMGAYQTQRLSRREVLAGATAAIGVAGLSPAVASPDSAWSPSSHSAMRLVDGGPDSASRGQHLAAIALRLNPGFKTYWRHPGDSGVPPQFNFEGSTNLRRVTVHFPAPQRFDDGAGGVSFGYVARELLLPLTVSAVDPAKPVTLRMKADYAVCEKLCVPATGAAELQLKGGATAHGEAIRQAMAMVPRPVSLGAPGPLRVIGLTRGAEAGRFLVEIAAPEGTTPDLFIEAPQPWFFEVAAAAGVAAGQPMRSRSRWSSGRRRPSAPN